MAWKSIENAPRNKRIIVANDKLQESCIAAFERLSEAEAVYGWVFGYARGNSQKRHLLPWEPTHWDTVPAIIYLTERFGDRNMVLDRPTTFVTAEMRAAGASVLAAQRDVLASEELAAAVYSAMSASARPKSKAAMNRPNSS